eukprot:2188634-Rhodomonas_salina.1
MGAQCGAEGGAEGGVLDQSGRPGQSLEDGIFATLCKERSTRWIWKAQWASTTSHCKWQRLSWRQEASGARTIAAGASWSRLQPAPALAV